ncbi:MAG: phage head-tail connector protein [Hyphomicrobiales bacterium]|nr:head-tail connector protein [Rickettsiales bacterium]MCP5362265.1 phage head-tail connector protein [Hyphomicrobiales bacterium]
MTTYFPTLTLITAPAEEPLSLSEAKLYLRVDSSDEDSVITRMIATARQAAEHYTRRSFITQTWTLAYDDYAPAMVALPKGPVQSITSVKTIARDATETVISSSVYTMDAGKNRLLFDADILGLVVQITYVAGYGDASSIPEALKQGMLAHIADLYEQRPNYAGLPLTARDLYAPYRSLRL